MIVNDGASVPSFLGVVHLNTPGAEEIHPLRGWSAVGHDPGDHIPVHYLAKRSGSEFAVVHEQHGLAAIADRTAVEVGAFKVNGGGAEIPVDRKSTRLNSSHLGISYAV